MKKIVLVFAALLVSVASHAQFEADKLYVGASLSSLDLSYNGLQNGRIGLQGKVGYLFDDNMMLLSHLAYDKMKDVPFALSWGLGGRYYMEQNGLFFGVSATYRHGGGGYNDVLPGIQVGYSFFISRTVTIEPEIYYDQSFKNHSDYSTIGLRVGFGIYLFQDQRKN